MSIISTAWTPEEVEILKKEYSTTYKTELVKLFNNKHKWSSILWQAHKLKLTRPNIRTFKLKFLLENSIDNAYWWGFIMSDGHISEDGKLRISLHKQDYSHLNVLSKKIGAYINKYKSQGNMICLEVGDKINALKLKNKLGILKRKTYNPPLNFNFLKTPEEFLAFFIGFTDGDGCLTFNKKNVFKSIRIVVHGNWIEFFRNFCKSLSEKYPNLKFTVNNTNKRGNTTVYIGTKSTYCFLSEFIKRNQLTVLNRKWKIN